MIAGLRSAISATGGRRGGMILWRPRAGSPLVASGRRAVKQPERGPRRRHLIQWSCVFVSRELAGSVMATLPNALGMGRPTVLADSFGLI